MRESRSSPLSVAVAVLVALGAVSAHAADVPPVTPLSYDSPEPLEEAPGLTRQQWRSLLAEAEFNATMIYKNVAEHIGIDPKVKPTRADWQCVMLTFVKGAVDLSMAEGGGVVGRLSGDSLVRLSSYLDKAARYWCSSGPGGGGGVNGQKLLDAMVRASERKPQTRNKTISEELKAKVAALEAKKDWTARDVAFAAIIAAGMATYGVAEDLVPAP